MHPYRGLRTSLFPSIRGVYVQAFQQHEIVKRRTEIGGSRSGDTRWGPSLSAFPLLDAPSLRAYEARGDSYPKDCRSSYALSLAGDFRRGQSIRGYTVRSSILFAGTLAVFPTIGEFIDIPAAVECYRYFTPPGWVGPLHQRPTSWRPEAQFLEETDRFFVCIPDVVDSFSESVLYYDRCVFTVITTTGFLRMADQTGTRMNPT